jgi:PIN domain nuclease of toxin-antitoxin system
MSTFVVDTHALAWFFAEDSRLSSEVNELLIQAELGNIQILIPTIVLAELTLISARQRVVISITDILVAIQQSDNFIIVDFNFPIFQAFLNLPDQWDLHDRIIGATAKYYSVPLLTRDNMLRNSDAIDTYWDESLEQFQ